jgi:hypothetical protein
VKKEEMKPMDVFIVGLCFTFFSLAVTAAAFAAATRPAAAAEQAQPEMAAVKTTPARFFAERVPPTLPKPVPIPIELLLQQLENHVRLEQAAAESFVAFPTKAMLHSKTTSPFVN